jgi:PAS domain S-box-containing protein
MAEPDGSRSDALGDAAGGTVGAARIDAAVVSGPAAVSAGRADIDPARAAAGLLRERLRLYEANMGSASVGQLLVAALLLWEFRPLAGAGAMGLFVALLSLTLGTRIAHGLRLRRLRSSGAQPSPALLWQARLAVAASGASWGAAGLLLFPAGDLQAQTLLAFVLAGIAAGSLTLTAFDLAGAIAFATLALAPFAMQLLASGGAAAATMATMVLLFLTFLGLTGWRAQRHVRETVLAREAEAQRTESLLAAQHRLQQLADELRSQQEALAVTFDSMDQGILSLDVQGRTSFYNRRLSELLDIPETFFATRPTMKDIADYQLSHGHYGERFELVGPEAREPLQRWFAGDHAEFPPRYLRRTHTGRTLEVKSRYLAGGGLVRTFSDVSAFFDAQQQLRHSRAQEGKLALVAAHTDNAVAITDAEDRIEWVNDAFVRITGRPLEAAFGRTLGRLLRDAGGDADLLARMDAELRREHKSAAELRCRLDDGRAVWLALETHAVLGPDGTRLQTIALGRDVTERHEAEAALRTARDAAEHASRAKSEFLSAMSHELRTPLNAILGFAQLLQIDRTHALPERQRGHVQHILRAGEHLLHLINDVLDMARVEAGKQRIQVEAVDLGPLLDECLALMRPLAQERSIRLDAGSAPASPRQVAADRTRLRQVLLNLLSNAIKYNRDGGMVRIDVEDVEAVEDRGDLADTVEVVDMVEVVNTGDAGQARRGREPGGVRVGITDTGHGFDAGKRARLFQAFDRLGAEEGPVPGAGLGLALSRRMVELMSGRIEVDSEPGRGSTFWVHLRRAGANEPAAGAAAPDPVPARAGNG